MRNPVMQVRWLQFAGTLGIRLKAAEAIWLDLAEAYGEDGRIYHTLIHIQHAWGIANQLQSVATDFTAVQLAIWFHDVVYDPRRSDNEAQSAAYTRRVLQPLGVAEDLLDTVADLILATKNHETAVPDPNKFVVIDADLAVLSAPPQQYDAYARAIRREYSFVPDEAYRAGRTAVLRRFLARSPFYFTEWMRERGDTAAQQNLSRELAQLENWDTERH